MSLFLCKKEIVEQEMAEVYQYGFEIIFSTLIGFFITIAIGAVFRMFLVSLVYYFAFVALRQFTGGYHANTYLKCNLIFAASTTFIFGMAKIVAYGTYPISFHVLLLFFSLVAIWFKTPVENENKPLSEEQKICNHRISMIVAVIFSGISCFAYQKWVLISATIALTLFVIALMAVIANPSREEENES
ncbi:accessory gene regulator ArgB-like protein [uncultured Ruminococcus sp.]|nr:accessory gene regulator B family protein [uncultured Ruminococcus sp.]